MTSRKQLQVWLKVSSTVLLALLAVFSLREKHISAQDFPAIVGRIEGNDLEVVTTTPTGAERNAAPTNVASGSDITLRSGHALLALNSGGEISICGPAHLKLLKAGGAVTVALDYGRVHPSIESSQTFTIYTPTVIATPISISGAASDTTVGLEQTGEMCVLTSHGAMRVQPQFSDQSLIVPQGGAANLVDGQIELPHGNGSSCECEFPRAKLERPQPAPQPQKNSPQIDIGVLSRPVEPARSRKEPPPQAPPNEPVYTVLMPALTFDAKSPEPPPEPDPETILLVREVRLRPSAVYHGHVNAAPAPVPAVTATAPAPQEPTAAQPPQSPPGIIDRMRNFYRKLTGRGPCAGSGCNG